MDISYHKNMILSTRYISKRKEQTSSIHLGGSDLYIHQYWNKEE